MALIYKESRRLAFAAMVVLTMICAFASMQQAPRKQPPTKTTSFTRPKPTRIIRPEIPKADRSDTRRVFLEKADSLYAPEPEYGTSSYQIVKGNVAFRQGGMWMYCDSAYYYPDYNSLNAYGNVKMQSGDTLTVFADVLFFDGNQKYARLRNRGKQRVRLINRDVTLTTDSLDYSIPQELGWYYNGGQIDDKTSRLTSDYGQYSPATKEAEFYNQVVLRGQNGFLMNTDTLFYNTRTHIARITSPTDIKGTQDEITTTGGEYNTATMEARLTARSIITHRDSAGRVTTLEGDSIIYDSRTRESRAFKFKNPLRHARDMVLTDTAHKLILKGGFGYYNDSTKMAFATDYPLLIEHSRPDTLFLRADSIKTWIVADTVTKTKPSREMHIAEAFPRARFFRTDIQGVADTIRSVEADSMIYLLRKPIVWTGNRQINGNVIMVHMNDSTADRVDLPNHGVASEWIDEEFYDQLSANQLTAFLENQTLRHLDAEGNVQSILLPQEKDSTYNKLVYSESSFLSLDMENGDVKKIKMWPETEGKVIPLFMVKKADIYLPTFRWYETLRPRREWYGGNYRWADDLGDIPDELEEYFAAPDEQAATSTRRISNSKNERTPVSTVPLK